MNCVFVAFVMFCLLQSNLYNSSLCNQYVWCWSIPSNLLCNSSSIYIYTSTCYIQWPAYIIFSPVIFIANLNLFIIQMFGKSIPISLQIYHCVSLCITSTINLRLQFFSRSYISISSELTLNTRTLVHQCLSAAFDFPNYINIVHIQHSLFLVWTTKMYTCHNLIT